MKTTNNELSFLESLFPTMVAYSISGANKYQFVTSIIEANKELDKPFPISVESLEAEIQKLIEQKQITETKEHYYFPGLNKKTDIIRDNGEYTKLIRLFIQKNMVADKFLQKLFSAMAIDLITEVKKDEFISTLLEANQELDKPFPISQRSLKGEIKKLLAEEKLQEEHYYYHIGANMIQDKVFKNVNEEQKHAYFKLVEAYITKNMEANQKKKV